MSIKSVPTCLHDNVFCGVGLPLLVIFYVVEIHECEVLGTRAGAGKKAISKNRWAEQEGGRSSVEEWRSMVRERQQILTEVCNLGVVTPLGDPHIKYPANKMFITVAKSL